MLITLRAPLAAVIDAGDARHSEQQAVQQRQMALLPQDGGRTCDIVIIHKGQQMFAAVEGVAVAAKLPVEGVGKLEEIQVIQAGIEALAALVIGAAVEHRIVDNAVIIAKEDLPQQQKVWPQRVAEGAQPPHELLIQAVGHVQTQAVNPEFIHPLPHASEQVIDYLRIVQV